MGTRPAAASHVLPHADPYESRLHLNIALPRLAVHRHGGLGEVTHEDLAPCRRLRAEDRRHLLRLLYHGAPEVEDSVLSVQVQDPAVADDP